MKLFTIAFILALTGTSPAIPQSRDLNSIIDAVDRNLASMKDFSADFVQNSSISVNQRQQSEGHLSLTRDRKMRWEYRKPEEQLFVSNGKTLYSYRPLDHEVGQEKVTDSIAERVPMMFLVGRANLRKEFKEFEELNTPPKFEGNRVIRLTPNRKNEEIQRIEIEVNPVTNLIVRMVVAGTDKSSNEMIFTNIQVNKNIPSKDFEFMPPPGTRVVPGAF